MKILNLALALVASVAWAKESDYRFVEIRPDVKLYVEFSPAAPGQPTIFLLNGLTYTTREYDSLVQELLKVNPGFGIVRYDMQGMGQTLLTRNGRQMYPPEWPSPLKPDASYRDLWTSQEEWLRVMMQLGQRRQTVLPPSGKDPGRLPIEQHVKDLRDLVRVLDIQGPKIAAGLSFGGAVGLLYSTRYPKDFDQFIAIAPFLERLPDQDQWIKTMMQWHRMYIPFDRISDSDLYDFYLSFVVSTYPAVEPILYRDWPHRVWGAFRNVQGAKDWNAWAVAEGYPEGKVHIIGSIEDEFVKIERLNNLWEKIPRASRTSYLRLKETTENFYRRGLSNHKIPEKWPAISAWWINQILSGNPELFRGLVFDAEISKGEAISGSVRLPLPSGGKTNCETLL